MDLPHNGGADTAGVFDEPDEAEGCKELADVLPAVRVIYLVYRHG
jgi:hypothetical protein